MHVLFLCTVNSCRSQMAEAWARQLAPLNIQVQSAGIEPQAINPHALAVMAEAGVDISNQESTKLVSSMLAWTDVVVTVCGDADENCPVLPAHVHKIHWPLHDPAKATGTEEEIMAAFRASRDDIRQRVQQLMAELTATA
jgi:arsenate reductase